MLLLFTLRFLPKPFGNRNLGGLVNIWNYGDLRDFFLVAHTYNPSIQEAGAKKMANSRIVGYITKHSPGNQTNPSAPAMINIASFQWILHTPVPRKRPFPEQVHWINPGSWGDILGSSSVSISEADMKHSPLYQWVLPLGYQPNSGLKKNVEGN